MLSRFFTEMTKEKRYKWRREDYKENTRGLLMVNTGDGKGKTTCALGLILRAVGQGLRCCLIQFMKAKGDKYGEHISLEELGVEVHTMGDGFTWDTEDRAQDIKTSEETWALCSEKLNGGEYDLLVFDELVYVLDYKFLDETAVLNEIEQVRKAQPALHIVMTGRNASDKLIEAADLVTKMEEVKHPFNNGIFAQKGIEF